MKNRADFNSDFNSDFSSDTNFMLFKSDRFPNVYIIGDTHTICEGDVMQFLRTLRKVDIVILEDPLPFVYLSPKMNKIAETYYLGEILSSNTKDNGKCHVKEATELVAMHYNIPNLAMFTRALIIDSFDCLEKVNKQSKLKIISADSNLKKSLESQESIEEFSSIVSNFDLNKPYMKYRNECVELFQKKQYSKLFLTQANFSIQSICGEMFKKIGYRNTDWAENIYNKCLKNYNGETIVMFCGCMHLNVFLDNNLINIFAQKYDIHFTCEGVNKSLPNNIFDDLNKEKEAANLMFCKKEINQSYKMYTRIFESYKIYCSYKDLRFLKEYSNIISNMLTCCFKNKLEHEMAETLKIGLDFLKFYKLDGTGLALERKIEFIRSEQKL